MGEWKAQISFGARQDLRREMEEFADKERRKTEERRRSAARMGLGTATSSRQH
jgi:hypothetical protein